MSKILVTGSTGFIGKRLVYKLLEEGHSVSALIRIKGTTLNCPDKSNLNIIYGNMGELFDLESFPKDIEAAYYLMHSLGSDSGDLIEHEKKIAKDFLVAIEKTSCKQIIFLTGIIEDEKNLSEHLHSRLRVEEVLQTSKIPVTILRASIIIGSGSASFEIIRDLVEKLPLMVAPKWIKNSCQPIAIRDVLFYLNATLLNPLCFNKTYDIGGPEAITFKEVLLRYARFRHLKRFIINVPVLTPRLSSYWLVFISSVRFSICKYLVESMEQGTRKLNNAIDEVLPHKCLSYEEALSLAFQKIAQNEVISTWMDNWHIKKNHSDVQDFIEVPQEGCYKDIKIVPVTEPFDNVEKRIWSIGGANGWFSMNWAWRLRGLIDQMVGGTGLNRGRRDPFDVEVGDSIDFWRVILADKTNTHLILYAEMKVPGEAWLEFEIDKDKKVFKQTATFRPIGFSGRLYWYMSLPFHWVIFTNMANSIAKKTNC